MTTLRRYLSLCALLFWQGGFTFYAAVVIPIAGSVLIGRLHLRARITDQATSVLNWSGVIVLALLLWDLAVTVAPSRRRRRLRGGAWAVLFATLAALFLLHSWMDALDPAEAEGPANAATFFVIHSVYVWISTAQWLAALVYLGVTVRAWRGEDGEKDDKQAVLAGKEKEVGR